MKHFSTDGAPKAIGPYSQAVLEGGFPFASGQIPLDPRRASSSPAGSSPRPSGVLDNMEAVLKSAGLAFHDVVKTTVFLVKSEDFPAMNAIYARRFGDHRPARSTVIVAALPKGAVVEIDLIARVKDL
jgi:2-iminobutanoate/2-iminopropanoate deaminase